ncbi:hypothetical protein G3567_11060 [Psychroflexus sp. YR1-1]|uniref:Thrombospondin type 3 repeat-containing protein n=1 Tax=Psychroflexus aurantiacus TaxID=2709310 RepID=A0A6B3R2V4_9FLAO|nr:hypothetical protein [Psychroflexus aurantiacus]NEV94682.1 hypothetical protein [Psychroflexus aurantiacus]
MNRYLLFLITASLLCLGACSESGNSSTEVEICDDGIDNDGDGLTDCEDGNCALKAACVESNCADGIDNDGDGFADCDDLDCEEVQECLFERCIDGVDNDNDGLIDCDDPDCNSNLNCN